MGGTKRKLPMERIEKKESRAVSCNKRRNGLYSKASQLCLLSAAQIAILTTPPPSTSSESRGSFFSFGHSSVDDVVATFLADQRPVRCFTDRRRREDLGLGFWWENESLAKSENAEELRGAMDSISKMLNDLKENRRDHQDNDIKKKKKKKKDLVLQETQELDQTLNIQSNSAAFRVPDDRLKTDTEMGAFDDHNLAIPESFCITDKSAKNFDWCSYQDLDQLIDFGTTSKSLLDMAFETFRETDETLLMNSNLKDVSIDLCSVSEGVED